MSDWIFALTTNQKPVGPRLDPIFWIADLSSLVAARLVETLFSTLLLYLDSQQKWHDYAQRGLTKFLPALCDSMQLRGKELASLDGIKIMSIASRLLPRSILAALPAQLGDTVLLAHDCLLVDTRLGDSYHLIQ